MLWTNSGSQGWRPVGGLVLDGDLQHIDKSNNEIKIVGERLGQRGLLNTASQPKARPAVCPSSWFARLARACWPA